MAIDAAALIEGYLRVLPRQRRATGDGCRGDQPAPARRGWTVTTPAGAWRARDVVNAAGGWADDRRDPGRAGAARADTHAAHGGDRAPGRRHQRMAARHGHRRSLLLRTGDRWVADLTRRRDADGALRRAVPTRSTWRSRSSACATLPVFRCVRSGEHGPGCAPSPPIECRWWAKTPRHRASGGWRAKVGPASRRAPAMAQLLRLAMRRSSVPGSSPGARRHRRRAEPGEIPNGVSDHGAMSP